MANEDRLRDYLKLATVEEWGSEPVAIVGIGHRCPSGAGSPHTGHAGASDTPYSGFVQDTRKSDPGFLGIRPREALEREESSAASLRVSWARMFAEASASEYDTDLLMRNETGEGHLLTGTSASALASRVSFIAGPLASCGALALILASRSGPAAAATAVRVVGLAQNTTLGHVSITWLEPDPYAAANVFLDALAQHRRVRGLPTTSLVWRPWDGGGMGSQEGGQQLQRIGVILLDPALAIKVLAQAPDGDGGLPSTARFAQDLAALPPAGRDKMLTGSVRARTAAALGHSCTDAVQVRRSFSGLGIDSLTALELRNLLAEVMRAAAARYAGPRLPHLGGAGAVPADRAARGFGRRWRRGCERGGHPQGTGGCSAGSVPCGRGDGCSAEAGELARRSGGSGGGQPGRLDR
jgi:hypothetical protein